MQSQYPNQAYQYYSNLPYSAWPLAPVYSPQLYTPGYKSRVEGPTFPSFINEDPHEYAMLKMALRNLLPPWETEIYKYHVLLDHLKLPSAKHIALAYSHDPQPYSKSIAALDQQYGQPHHLALKEITTILNLPKVQSGDAKAFHNFAVRVQSLVGMLQAMGQNKGAAELACSLHVQHLVSKLPPDSVANFICYNRSTRSGAPYTIVDFATWLQSEAECQSVAAQIRHLTPDNPMQMRRPMLKSATIRHGNSNPHLPSPVVEPGTKV